MLEIRGVTKDFSGALALRGVDLEIADGEFFALLGPSGCGKTTLLRLLAGFEAPSSGSIHMDGERIDCLPPNRRSFNMVFQKYALFPHLSVRENVEFGLRMKRVAPRDVRSRAEEALSLVRLEGFGERSVTTLSGGQQQRVALARALVNRPRVLLLDEPLSALDLKLRQQMQIELRAIHRQVRQTFVFVTHDQEEALTLADRVAVMNDGRVEQVGTPREIYERPRTSFVARFIGSSNFWSGVLRLEGKDTVFGTGHGEEIRVLLEGALPPGRVHLLIRPERVRILSRSRATVAGGENRFEGVVRDVVYRGSFTDYLVDCPRFPQEPLLASAPNARDGIASARFAPGDPVVVEWSGSDAQLLPTDEGL